MTNVAHDDSNEKKNHSKIQNLTFLRAITAVLHEHNGFITQHINHFNLPQSKNNV